MSPLHTVTPLWESHNPRLNAQIWLKMEAFQPTASFKIRGMGRLCQEAQAAGAQRFVCASGGNAGLAVAYAGRKLGVPTTIVVPQRASARSRALITRQGAHLLEHGDAWDEAHSFAVDLAELEAAAYIHPFDGAPIWSGHATMIHEAAEQGPRPNAVVVSVGGGGLLCGVLEGMRDVGWDDVPVLAVETDGAASYAAAVAAGKPVRLEQIQSIAVTLSARQVCPEAIAWAQRRPVQPWLVSDREALDACLRFADEQRVLVEPACGAALATVDQAATPLVGAQHVLVIVCGGAGVTLSQLRDWDAQVA